MDMGPFDPTANGQPSFGSNCSCDARSASSRARLPFYLQRWLILREYVKVGLMTNNYIHAHADIIDLLPLAGEEVQFQDDCLPSFVRSVLLVELEVDGFDQPFTLNGYLKAKQILPLVSKKKLRFSAILPNGL